MGVVRAEPPVYRPFALLAFGTAAGAGVPLGVWMLTRFYLGGDPVPAAWILLHAHLQIFGLFGVLILGVAHHLVPRFVGRPVTRSRSASVLLALMLGALVCRLVGVTGGPAPPLLAAALEIVAFALFAVWLWRALAPPPLALTRRHLTAATAWLLAGLLLEAALRGRAMAAGLAAPDAGGMRAAHAMATLGGVGGWMLGVLLRAGPMFVAGWRVSPALARAAPWALGLGILTAAAGEAAGGAAGAVALAKLGEGVAIGTIATLAVAGGALGRPGGRRSLLARGGPELWLFRLAMVSVAVAAPGFLVAALLAWRGVPLGLLVDALRHLVAVGFLTAMAVGMTFRLIPVFDGIPVPWPRLRVMAFAGLVAGVVLRSSEVLASWGWGGILPWIPLSGPHVWLPVAAVLASLLGVIRSRWGAAAPPAPRG